jgi:hypothetical protein
MCIRRVAPCNSTQELMQGCRVSDVIMRMANVQLTDFGQHFVLPDARDAFSSIEPIACR